MGCWKQNKFKELNNSDTTSWVMEQKTEKKNLRSYRLKGFPKMCQNIYLYRDQFLCPKKGISRIQSYFGEWD